MMNRVFDNTVTTYKFYWLLSIMLADVVIHSITVVVDAFVGIALGKFFPEDVANGDDDGCPGFLLVERMIHCGQLCLYLLQQFFGSFNLSHQ